MNIKNRLKKIQRQVIKEDSEFCDCEKEIITVVLIPTADGGQTTLSGEPYTEPPEFCETCGKPNEKLEPIHATFNFNSDVELTGQA
jgi:hypothetical protein